jgi:hypothetical protein
VILITPTTSHIKLPLLCLQMLWIVNLLVLEEVVHHLTVLGKQLTYFQISYL